MKDFLKRHINKFTYVIPKKRNLYAFLPIHDSRKFSGNIKSHLLYVKENHPELHCVLLTSHKNVAQEAEKLGIRTTSNKISFYWNKFRAELIFVDASAGSLGYGRYKFVQLWHGAGFKYVGILWEKEEKPTEKRRKIYRKIYDRCELVAATSESNAEIQNRSFVTDKATITGYPRNDLFFLNSGFPESIRKKYGLETYNQIITYAPTFRDKQTHPPFSAEFWRKLNTLLEEKNEILVIKKHPYEKFLIPPDSFSHVKDVTEKISDTQELLLITDILITDYSSISTDFAITKKPIVIYAYDLEEYMQNCRGMAYDLEKTLPKPFIKTEAQLLEILQDRSWFELPEVKKSYEKFRKTFHHYLDGNASRRIMEKILNN